MSGYKYSMMTFLSVSVIMCFSTKREEVSANFIGSEHLACIHQYHVIPPTHSGKFTIHYLMYTCKKVVTFLGMIAVQDVNAIGLLFATHLL